MNEWANALAEAQQIKCDIVPKGWNTARQVAEQLGKAPSYGRHLIREMKNVDSRKFRIMTSRGVYPVVHYKLGK